MAHELVDSHEQSGGVSMESNRRSDDPMSLKFAEALSFVNLDTTIFSVDRAISSHEIETRTSSFLVPRAILGCFHGDKQVF